MVARYEAGGSKNVIIQECPAGLVRLRRTGGKLSFAAPPLLRYGPVEELLVAHLTEILGVARDEIEDSHRVDNGPGWVAVLLGDAEEVLRLKVAQADLSVGVTRPYPPGSDASFELRAFFPAYGAGVEDPVTGRLNARWPSGSRFRRVKDSYVASQGTALGRSGRVYVYIERDEDGTIWVGGGTVSCVEGAVEL